MSLQSRYRRGAQRSHRFVRLIRDELLNAHTFATIEEARDLADAWKKDYNEPRPHSSLGGLTPLEYANKL
jgi:transposase InsO family protein